MPTIDEAVVPAAHARPHAADGLPVREVRDLPEPPRNYWRLVGPGIVAGGVGLSSGEFVLWPFIASQVGLILLWGAIVGCRDAVLSEYGSRAIHARHWRDRGDWIQPVLEALGARFRRPRVLRESVAGMGNQLRNARQLSVRRQRHDHRHRQSSHHRVLTDVCAGDLRGARAIDFRQSRRSSGAGHPRDDVCDRARFVGGIAGRAAWLRHDSRRPQHRAGLRRRCLCRFGWRAESLPEQLDQR